MTTKQPQAQTQSIHLGRLSRQRPTVNFANYADTQPGQDWGPRIIPDCQLVYIISGKAELTLGPAFYTVQAGECVFYGAGSPHKLVSTVSDPITFSSIHFRWNHTSAEPDNPVPRIRNCLHRDLQKPAVSYIVEADDYGDVTFPHHFALPAIEPLFLQIAREYRDQEPGYPGVLRGLMMQLLTLVVRHQIRKPADPAERNKIAPALDAIEKQPDFPWSTGELAALCGYHPTYFAALFRSVTGFAPKHYILLERIRKAKELLLQRHPVEEVAVRLGFSGIHYFSRHFKAMTGFTPTEFKKLHSEL